MLGTVPIIIPCFNNPTYVEGMLAQLRALNAANIVLLDNASTHPRMLALLRREQKEARIIRLKRNNGPHYFYKNLLFYLRLPNLFCVTDPDLKFNEFMPADFISILHEATEKSRIGKAGLALDISAPHRMRSDCIRHAGKTYKIWEWEAQFWRDQISTTAQGDPIFKAPIDTTFALYNKRFFKRRSPHWAVRFGGRFTAEHLPWYLDNGLPAEEENFYRAGAASYSWYFGRKTESEARISSGLPRTNSA